MICPGRVFSSLISLCILVSGTAFAGPIAASKAMSLQITPRLTDYVLPSERLVKMKPADQIAYMAFLTGLMTVIELSQDKNPNSPSSKADNFLDIETKSKFAFDWSFLPQAMAREVPNGDETIVPFAGRDLGATKKATPAVVASDFFTAEYLRDILKMPKAPMSLRESIALAFKLPATSNITDATKTDAKKEGAGCLFAGHGSTYQMRNKTLRCVRPSNYVNSEDCKGTAEAPKVRCNTFGMLNGPKKTDLAEKTCINLFPVDHLTLTCSQNILDWLKGSTATFLNRTEYDAWYAGVVKSVKEFEENFANGQKLTEYCATAKNQTEECKAVLKLISALKTASPGAVTQVAQNAVGTPATAAAATTGPAPAATSGKGAPANKAPTAQ